MSSACTTEREAPEWIRAGEAAAILGVSTWSLRTIARKGAIGTLTLPGTQPRYWRSDVERLAREAVRPAEVE